MYDVCAVKDLGNSRYSWQTLFLQRFDHIVFIMDLRISDKENA